MNFLVSLGKAAKKYEACEIDESQDTKTVKNVCTELLSVIETLLKDLPEISVEGFELGRIWADELAEFVSLVHQSRNSLEQLEKCVKGTKVLDNTSRRLSGILLQDNVPHSWCLKHPSKKTSVRQYITNIQQRTDFYKVRLAIGP